MAEETSEAPFQLIDNPVFNLGGEDSEAEAPTPAPGWQLPPPELGAHVRKDDPEEMGAPPAVSSLIAPSLFKGGIEALTFLVDLPTHAVDATLRKGAELTGIPYHKGPPVTLGGIVTELFEAPATIETAITGKEPGFLTKGFSATPRAARSGEEQFYADVAYMLGGSLTFPVGLAGAFKTYLPTIKKMMRDAGTRGLPAQQAQKALDAASKSPNPAQALVQAAREYAERFGTGLGTKPARTLGWEAAIGLTVGGGYGFPELLADDEKKITMDLGDDLGEVDVKPALKILTSMGLPIFLAHTPTGFMIAGDKTKITPLLKTVMSKARAFGGSLLGGMHEGGQKKIAARIFNDLASEPGFLENVFLPAVESGMFRNPATSPPRMRVLPDGSTVLAEGGLRPDTLQAMRQLGVDDSRLAALDSALQQKGTNLQAIIGENTRRAQTLDETFESLRVRLEPGDEAATAATVERALSKLDGESLASLEVAVRNADEAYRLLEPEVGREMASELATMILQNAKADSTLIRRELWSAENLGTDFVNANSLGDWAARQIAELGRAGRVSPGMGVLYKLAGKTRLNEIAGVGETGKPLKQTDLGGVKDTGDIPLTPDDIADNGLFDVFGKPGTIYGDRVRIAELDKFRSEVGGLARAAARAGRDAEARRYHQIRDEIDNNVLTEENIIPRAADDAAQATYLRNLKIARAYVADEKARWGPQSEIGRLLYGTKVLDEAFLEKLLKAGPTSGRRVEEWRNAINEPQRVVENDNVTWERDPEASLIGRDISNPNVIEAELLRRFTERVPKGEVTQKNIDRFVRDYKEAIGKIPGLQEKFSDLHTMQGAVDAMGSKLTTPSREAIFNALKNGATIEDIEVAKKLLGDNLRGRQLRNTASEYLNADVDAMAAKFIDRARSNPEFAESMADDLENLLRVDTTGASEAGFRGALWRALRKASSRGQDPETGDRIPGIDTTKLVNAIEETRPFLSRFFDDNQMAFLDELVKGGPLQEAGTAVAQARLSPHEIMAGKAAFGTTETVAAGSRTAGQWAFGTIGINPLVATGMGRRIGAYIFERIGQDKIFRIVEEAFRNPEKAAELVRLYKDLPEWKPPEKVREIADAAIDDPGALALEGVTEGRAYLKRMAKRAGDYLKNYSSEAIQRAVRLGLLPAQAESRKIDLETDYMRGPPFQYEDNKIRYNIEQQLEAHSRIPGPTPPEPAPEPAPGWQLPPPGLGRPPGVTATPSSPPVKGSILNQTSPVGGRLPAQVPASPSPDTMDLGRRLFGAVDPVFSLNRGGLLSAKSRKGRQLVG